MRSSGLISGADPDWFMVGPADGDPAVMGPLLSWLLVPSPTTSTELWTQRWKSVLVEADAATIHMEVCIYIYTYIYIYIYIYT